ncbi:MAG: tetratricopeptide repeat protein [Ilumatobacter sp.]
MSSHVNKLLAALLFAGLLIGAGAVGVSRISETTPATAAGALVIEPGLVAATTGPPAADLDGLIAQLQTRLDVVPGDSVAWSTLGLAYVQQARVTADPSFYPRADAALDRSVEVQPDDNFLALAGRSALASARHEFGDAKTFAEQGLAVNAFSALLWGALSDAELQLGNYDAATEAVDQMIRLSPDTSSYSRASYLAELRGEIPLARSLMEAALESAGQPSDQAFALTILGNLSFDSGEPGAALTQYNRARSLAPGDVAALAGKARAEAALGQHLTALDHYAELVEVAPEPSFLIEYARLLESLGRGDEAAAQYAVIDSVLAVFDANGVELDAGPLLDLAERGDPVVALAESEQAVRVRPFLAIHDAHAWALYANGRYDDALLAVERAKETGASNARVAFHSGMIKLALGDRAGAREDLERAMEINPFFDPLDAVTVRTTLAELGGAS